jgi:cobalt-zinc-cadmium efflux system outer membrane protein
MMRFSLLSPKVFRRTRSTSSEMDRYCPSPQWLCLWASLAAIVFSTTGCRAPRKIRTSDYVGAVNQVSYSTANHSPVVAAVPPPAPDLGGPRPVEVYISYALSQNPDIEVARKRVDVAAYRVPQAASLRDPTFGVTAFPEPVQTAAGQQEVALTASQHLPWFGKLSTRAAAAEADTNVARAQLAAVELEVIEQVKRAYYELYFIQKAIGITEENRKLLLDFVRIADSKYRTGKASQQDVLRAQVEVSNLDNRLIRLRQRIDSSQAKLARLLHVSPDTPVRALEQPPQEQIPQDLESLYEQAIAGQPELHAQLAAVKRDRRKVELARLEYFPDLTAGVSWLGTSATGLSPVANGEDPLLLGFSVNVPIHRKRLHAGVREAESRVVASTRQYDSLRDRTAESVKDLYSQATSQYDLVKLFRDDIIPKSSQTLEVSQAAYQVGGVDFLTLIDNWQQLLRFRIAYYRLESQLQQTLATLERVVGGQFQTVSPTEQVPLPRHVDNGMPAPSSLPAVPPDPPSQPQPQPGNF